MEAGGSVLVDQGMYTKRNNSSFPAAFITGGIHNDNSNQNYLLRRTTSGAATLFPPLYASSPLPAPTYSSLPPHLIQQPSPPLLPLPLSRSFSLPPPGPPVSKKRIKDQRKPRSSPTKGPQPVATRPHKEPPACATAPVKLLKPAAATACRPKDEPVKDGDFTDDVYALSPPPSSLPMPKFYLGARTPPSSSSSSCNAEAFGGVVTVGGGVDAVASNDLRQLLRL